MRCVIRFASLLVMFVLILMPAHAQRLEKKASTRGAIVPSGACLPGSTSACMSITPLTSNTAAFVNFGNGAEDASWTLYEVPTTQSVTFQLLTPTSLGAGSFICGDGFTPTDFGGFCTGTPDPDNTTAADFVTSSLNSSTRQVTFSFISTATGLPPDWVFYADPGDIAFASSSTVPEPGTLTLLACSLLGLASLGVKRLHTQS
jgi:hypothetical protein